MARKNIPVPHIPLKFEDAVDAFLKTPPPKKGKKGRKKGAGKSKRGKQVAKG